MNVNSAASLLASSYKTIPTQENRAYSGEQQPETAEKKKTTMKKEEKAVWEDALSVSLHSATAATGNSAGTSSYSRARHVVYKQNMLERREELLNSHKAELKNRTKDNFIIDTEDEKQKTQMKKAVDKYVVTEAFIRLPETDNASNGALTTIFGNYQVDKTFQMKLSTLDVQC